MTESGTTPDDGVVQATVRMAEHTVQRMPVVDTESPPYWATTRFCRW